jgi:hypothetical protein
MHSACRNVHLFDVPTANSVLYHATGRVRRLGQEKWVKVYDYPLNNSFNIRQLTNNLTKAVPAMALSLNRDEWQFSLNQESGSMEIPPFALNDDGTISLIPNAFCSYLPITSFLNADELVTKMLVAQSETTRLIRPPKEPADVVQNLLLPILAGTSLTDFLAADDNAID